MGVEIWLYPFLTSALEGGGWSALPPGKNPPVPIAQEAVWPPKAVLDSPQSKNVSRPCNCSSVVQSVAKSLYRLSYLGLYAFELNFLINTRNIDMYYR